MRFQFPAAGFGPVDIEKALLRTAAGDHGAEAGLLLLMSCGDWLPQLSHAGLIAVDICLDGCCGDGPTAQIDWGGVDEALSRGRLNGRRSEVGVLHAAASLAGARPVILRELAAGLDRRVVGPVQAAFAFATYDAEVRRTIAGP